VLCLWFLLVNILTVDILEKEKWIYFAVCNLCVSYWINKKRGMLGQLEFLGLALYGNLCFDWKALSFAHWFCN
jgi:hypothetical protein